jgi:aerobic carbon-monoxide dehydrogenase medium subunit
VSLLRPFELHRPRTADEACALLARLGEDAAVYAGGTELLLLMKEGLLRPRHLVDIKRISGLDEVVVEDDRITVGATVTHRVLERSASVHARCSVLTSVARHVANVRVRNVGTVGGNLAFADPHSDLATIFLALDARVRLVSPRGKREVALETFIRGPWETVRTSDELLTAVTWTPWPGRTAAAYVKFGLYERPTLGIAVTLQLHDTGGRISDARVVVGCVNPRPARAGAAEALLRGRTVTDVGDLVEDVAAAAAASADPADDLHGSADYKRDMVAVFTRRALRVAVLRARGGEPTDRYQYAVVA